jgi:hypothetical protein
MYWLFKKCSTHCSFAGSTKGRYTQTRTCVPVAYACVTYGLFDRTSKYKQQTLYKNEMYFVSNDILLQFLHFLELIKRTVQNWYFVRCEVKFSVICVNVVLFVLFPEQSDNTNRIQLIRISESVSFRLQLKLFFPKCCVGFVWWQRNSPNRHNLV